MSAAGNRPRLLVLTSTFPRWHDDHEPPFVYELCRHLSDRFAITVVAPHAPGAATRENMHGIDVVRFRYAPQRLELLAYAGGIPTNLKRAPWRVVLVPVFLLAMAVACLRCILRQRPQVMHAHWLIPGGLIATALKPFARKPLRVLMTAHGGDVYGLRGALATRVKRWALTRADRVTVVSAALAHEVAALGCATERVSVVPMGTDLRHTFVPVATTPSPAAAPALIYAGRLVEKKGIDTLLRSAMIARRQIPELKLTIAGHGPALQALEALSRELGIAESVEFTGPYRIDELPQLYAGAQLAVFPFRTAGDGDQDGFGLAIVEAMGCGIPVLGSDIAPLDDLLIDGVTGLRAPTDDADAFAAAIVACLGDPQAAARRARTAREQVVQRYDWSVIASMYAELLLAQAGVRDVGQHPPGN